MAIFAFYLRNRREKFIQQHWNFQGSLPEVSLLLAFRNESHRIRPLLESMVELNYPGEKIEIILVDDHSEDNSAELIKEFALSHSLPVKVMSLPPGKTGKKAAIALARQYASSDFLFFTDADARLPPDWIGQMLCCMQQSGASMVCSEIGLEPGGRLFQELEMLEQAALVAISAAGLAAGKPFLCNGAGYLITSVAFDLASRFATSEKFPGGDDVLLLHSVHKARLKTAYCRMNHSMVRLDTSTGFTDFLQQRIRWGSKVFLRKAGGNLVPAVLIWIFHGLFLGWLCLSLSLGLPGMIAASAGIFILRGLPEAMLVRDFIAQKSGEVKKNFFLFAIRIGILSPLYSLYVLLMGPLILLWRRFRWKGRLYA